MVTANQPGYPPSVIKMIRIENLSIQFQQGNQKVDAVKGISFEVGSQETVALVGESGSGKSVTAHAALKLLPSQAKCGGKIWLGKENLLEASESRMRQVRGQEIGMIFPRTDDIPQPPAYNWTSDKRSRPLASWCEPV